MRETKNQGEEDAVEPRFPVEPAPITHGWSGLVAFFDSCKAIKLEATT
jgi:hypothetical protein